MGPYKQLENKMEKITPNAAVTPRNILLLEKFRDRCLAESMSPRLFLKYLNYMPQHAVVLGKDFDGVTREDIQRVVAEIEKQPSPYREKSSGTFLSYLSNAARCRF